MANREIISINPFSCRMWEYHDRIDQFVDESTCIAEIKSFLTHGQLVPALGRRIQGNSQYEVELICGARRRFVAMHLNRPLLVEIRKMTDIEGVIAMDIENRHRLDISPYERGQSFRAYLNDGLFKSQDEIARKLHISASQVSRLLKLAYLPSAVVAAFRSPMDLRETWSQDLSSALERPESRESILGRARVIAQMRTRPSPQEILHQLLCAGSPGRKLKRPPHDEVVRDRHGAPLFRIRHLSNSVAFLLPLHVVPTTRLLELRSIIAKLMEGPQVGGNGFADAPPSAIVELGVQ